MAREQVIPLTEWQSLRIVLNEQKAWLAMGHGELDEFKKKSVQKQCKTILAKYGWIPHQFNYDNISLSMKKKQIEKYGEIVREFVNEYNKIIKSANLSKSQQMPKNYSFSDILSMSRFVNDSSPKSIKKMLNSMSDDALKQMVANNMCFYLDSKRRQKHLNSVDSTNNNKNHIHHEIVRTIKKKKIRRVRKHKVKYAENRFDTICIELSSHILSFCDEKEVHKALVCCHTLFNASRHPTTRTVVTINAQKLARQHDLFQDEIRTRYKAHSIVLKQTRTGYQKRFERYFNDILQNEWVKTISMPNTWMRLSEIAMDVLMNAVNCNIDSFHTFGTIEMDLPLKLLLNLKKLKIQYMNLSSFRNVQRLLIGEPNLSNSSSAIYQHIRFVLAESNASRSKLKHLCIFRGSILNIDTAFHPIYWLWTAKNLEKVTIKLDFNQDSNFEEQCELFLKHSKVLQIAKKQKSFTELTIHISNRHNVYVNDWKNMISCINKMYPNLKKIIYATEPWRDFRGELSKELNWKSCFGNMEYVELDLPMSMDNAMSLMKCIRTNSDDSFKALETLKFKHILMDCVNLKNDDKKVTADQSKIKCFLDELDAFLKSKPENLISIALKFRNRNVTNRESVWNRKMALIANKEVLNIIHVNSAFDGYFEFGFPRSYCSSSQWTGVELEYSHEIVQIIQKIKSRIAKDGEERKLILQMSKLRLHEDHIQFLKFWFGFDNIDYFEESWKGLQFVMPLTHRNK